MRLLPLILTAVLLLALVIKYVAATTSLAWVVRHGPDYREQLKVYAGDAMTIAEYWSVLDKASGRTFPFGIRQYRLTMYWHARRRSPILRIRAAAWLARVVELGFNIAALAVLCTAALVWLSSAPEEVVAVAPVTRALGTVLAVGLVAYPVTLAAELVCSYAKIGSYAGAFFRPRRYVRDTRSGQLIDEMQIFGFLLVLGYLLSSVALLYVGSRVGGFTDIQQSPGPGSSFLANLGNSLYFSFYNMLAEDDAGPNGISGRVLTLLISFQGCAIILVGFGALATLPTLTPREDLKITAPVNLGSGSASSQRGAEPTPMIAAQTPAFPRLARAAVAASAVVATVAYCAIRRKRRQNINSADDRVH